jgi:hypothetical protein
MRLGVLLVFCVLWFGNAQFFPGMPAGVAMMEPMPVLAPEPEVEIPKELFTQKVRNGSITLEANVKGISDRDVHVKSRGPELRVSLDNPNHSGDSSEEILRAPSGISRTAITVNNGTVDIVAKLQSPDANAEEMITEEMMQSGAGAEKELVGDEKSMLSQLTSAEQEMQQGLGGLLGNLFQQPDVQVHSIPNRQKPMAERDSHKQEKRMKAMKRQLDAQAKQIKDLKKTQEKAEQAFKKEENGMQHQLAAQQSQLVNQQEAIKATHNAAAAEEKAKQETSSVQITRAAPGQQARAALVHGSPFGH